MSPDLASQRTAVNESDHHVILASFLAFGIRSGMVGGSVERQAGLGFLAAAVTYGVGTLLGTAVH